MKNKKKSELLKNITALQAENKTASDLLKETQEVNAGYVNKLKDIKQEKSKIVEVPTKKTTAKESAVVENTIKLQDKKPESEVKTTRNTAKTTPEETKEKGKSQVDAIVAAMEEANSTQSKQSVKNGNTQ